MENGNKAKKQVTSSASSGNEKVRLHPTELITLEHPNDHNCLLHSAKGFAIGFLFAAVPSTLKSRKISTQYAFGLSALIGLFRCSNCLIHRLKQLLTQAKNPLNQFITPRLNVFISSFVSGLIALKVEPNFKGSVIMIWLWLKALRPPIHPVLFSTLSSAVLVGNWLANPREHSFSYKAFMDVFGGYRVENYYRLFHTDNPDNLFRTVCEVRHPNEGHFAANVSLFIRDFKSALPFYTPLHVIPFIFGQKYTIKSFVHLIESIVRSCTFLAGYCTLGWIVTCIIYPFLRDLAIPVRLRYYIVSFFMGLSIVFERPSRRYEMSIYCATQAINSIYRWARFNNVIGNHRHLESPAMALALAIFVSRFREVPQVVSQTLLGLKLSG